MATINFLYRSTKDIAFLNLRLLYRFGDKDYVIGGKTKEEVTKDYWQKYHDRKKIKDAEIRKTQLEVSKNLADLEMYLIQAFNSTSQLLITKEWLKNEIDLFYNPKANESEKPPESLVDYISFYIACRKHEIKPASETKFNVIRNKMMRLQSFRGHTIFIKDINEEFKREFVLFYEKNNYSPNTAHRELNLIKTFCKHAKYHGVEVHPQMEYLKLKKEKVEHIYLNFKEIEKIENARLESEHLDNARDWLIISCFTGQRVSDFMRFTNKMIRKEKGKYLLEFTQQKTNKNMTIPLHDKVRNILKKRKGEFPRKISDQKYNDYIKVVSKEAKLNEKVNGKLQKNISVKEGEKIIRNVSGIYKKWELVSSHIGRRSFATNFYGDIPTSFLIYMTGHSTEAMFLNYIGKSNKDLAMELTKYF